MTPGDTSCPGSASERVFAFVPLEAIPWAREAGIALPPLPPYTTAVDTTRGRGTLTPPPEGGGMDSSPNAPAFRLGSSEALRLTSPADGAVFHLSRELGPEDQTLRIEALPATPVRYVELYVDGALIGRVDAGPYRAWWSPSPGLPPGPRPRRRSGWKRDLERNSERCGPAAVRRESCCRV